MKMKINLYRLICNSDVKIVNGTNAGKKKLGRYLDIIKGWSREEINDVFRRTRTPSSYRLILRSTRQLVVKSLTKIVRQEISVANSHKLIVFKKSYLGSRKLTSATMIEKLVIDLAKAILSKENIISKFAQTQSKVNFVLKSAIYEL